MRRSLSWPCGLPWPSAVLLCTIPFFQACSLSAPSAAERLAGGAAVDASKDWPQFRGPTGMGTSGETGLPLTWSATENIVWKTELPGAGTSSPILVGDRIFLTCYSGYNVPGQRGGSQDDLKRHVVCLNRADGKLRWTKDVETKLPEQDRIRDDHGYASGTPASDGERVYIFFGKSGVVAFDFDGKQLWHADVGSNLHGWGIAASPVLYEDLVIVNASVESAVALSPSTRRTAAKSGVPAAFANRGTRPSWSAPKTARRSWWWPSRARCSASTPPRAEQLWSCDTDITWYMVPSLVADGGVVYCIGGRSGVAGLAVRAGGRGDVTRTHRLWTSKKGSNVSSPIYHDGHLYWVHDRGPSPSARRRRPARSSTSSVWRADQFYSSPLLADGRLYYLARDGRTFVLAAKPKFEQLGLNQIGERGLFNAGLVAADGKLYLRSNQRLYCIGKE